MRYKTLMSFTKVADNGSEHTQHDISGIYPSILSYLHIEFRFAQPISAKSRSTGRRHQKW